MLNLIIYTYIILMSFFIYAEEVKKDLNINYKENILESASEKDFYRIFEFDKKNGKIISLEKTFKVINTLKNLGLDEKARLVFYAKNECGSIPYQVAFKEVKEKDYLKIYTLSLTCDNLCYGKILYNKNSINNGNKNIELDPKMCHETIGGLFKKRLEKYKTSNNKELDNRIYMNEYKFIDDGL